MSALTLRPLDASHRDALADLLIETVAHGGSVSFMHPLSRQDASAFWDGSLSAAARGGRIVLGAFDGEALVALSRCISIARPINRIVAKSQK